MRRQGARADALIEVLQRVQGLEGYLSGAALVQMARELRLQLSQVYGVTSGAFCWTALGPVIVSPGPPSRTGSYSRSTA
ncbi:NAD(P)H-dependent oxidoreductase subunit E [Cyanobium sp. BSA11S]|uniref:NAD(P)H-dependent oxidoreductase subunit E n=1 Tax=Cyanobium sp. BSA11S TaxID=3108224 RepID=UPI003D8163FF